MSEEIFRIVVAVAVLVACLAFVVQAGIVFALYRLTRKMQDRTAGFMECVEPVLARVEPVIEQAGPVIDRIGPALDAIYAVAEKFGPAIDRFLPVADKAAVVVDRTGALIQSVNLVTATANRIMQESRPQIAEITGETAAIVRSGRVQVERAGELIQSVHQVTATANQIMEDTRPRIAAITGETAAIVRTGREQVERLGGLLQDAGDRARVRLEQIDHGVDATVNQIENVSGVVKSAVMRPVREVNGIAAGISAAVSTLVRGQHKSSVDSATQDEEMFI
jgi:ABC-type transporter Mla subunit MlaD